MATVRELWSPSCLDLILATMSIEIGPEWGLSGEPAKSMPSARSSTGHVMVDSELQVNGGPEHGRVCVYIANKKHLLALVGPGERGKQLETHVRNVR